MYKDRFIDAVVAVVMTALLIGISALLFHLLDSSLTWGYPAGIATALSYFLCRSWRRIKELEAKNAKLRNRALFM